MKNVHPRCDLEACRTSAFHLKLFRRPTHKQSIALATAGEPMRFGERYKGMCRQARIFQTTWKEMEG